MLTRAAPRVDAMTESQWLACADPVAMARFVRDSTESFRTRWLGLVGYPRFEVSQRKWRLLALAAAARAAGKHLQPAFVGFYLERIESSADDPLAARTLGSIRTVLEGMRDDATEGPGASAWAALCGAADEVPRGIEGVFTSAAACDLGGGEPAAQADLVRCVLGVPHARIRLDPTWRDANDAAALRVAEAIDRDRRFDDLPILADALDDAGADDALVAHCRAPGPHARGCWPVDLVLGRR